MASTPTISQRVANGEPLLSRSVLECAIELRRWRQRQAQNSLSMVIFDQRIHRGFRRCATNRQDAQLASERGHRSSRKGAFRPHFGAAVISRGGISGRHSIFRCQHILPACAESIALPS